MQCVQEIKELVRTLKAMYEENTLFFECHMNLLVSKKDFFLNVLFDITATLNSDINKIYGDNYTFLVFNQKSLDLCKKYYSEFLSEHSEILDVIMEFVF